MADGSDFDWNCAISGLQANSDVFMIASFAFNFYRGGGYTSTGGIFRKDGKEISVPVCRECQVQAPCSGWGGKYPYTREDIVDTKNNRRIAND